MCTRGAPHLVWNNSNIVYESVVFPSDSERRLTMMSLLSGVTLRHHKVTSSSQYHASYSAPYSDRECKLERQNSSSAAVAFVFSQFGYGSLYHLWPLNVCDCFVNNQPLLAVHTGSDCKKPVQRFTRSMSVFGFRVPWPVCLRGTTHTSSHF